MDYKKSGGARPGKGAPPHREKGAPGGRDNPFGGTSGKRKTIPAGDLDVPADPADDFAVDEQGTKNIRGTEEISNDNDESIAHRDD